MCFKIKIKTQPSPFGTNPETSEKKKLLDFEIHQKLERFSTLDVGCCRRRDFEVR